MMTLKKIEEDREGLELFNRAFPSSTFRIVHKETEGSEGKSPINGLVYGLDDALETIKKDDNDERLGWNVDSEHIVIDIDCDRTLDPTRDKAKRVFRLLEEEHIKTFLYTTEHGMHCYFKIGDYKTKNIVHVMCGLGIRIDIRVKGSYVVIPYNDPKRKWWNGSSIDLDVIPYYLKVISKSRSLAEFWNFKEHDGRNVALFSILNAMKTSQMCKFTMDEMKNSIILCNKYMPLEPMTEKELYTTVLRPENLTTNIKEDKASICSDYAIRINQENSVIYSNGLFFMIRDDTKIYKQMTSEEMDRFIYLNYTKQLSFKNRDEILRSLKNEAYCDWAECNRDPYDIPFQNGVYNAKTGGFRATLESDNLTYCIPHKYTNEAVLTPNAEAFYNVSLEGSIEKRLFFSQMLGYCMTRSAEFQVFFVFKGRANSGKSTMLKIMANILGKDNISNLQLTDFNNDFGLEALFNKLANLGDDISGTQLVDSQTFKKASSGDVINVNRKFMTSLVFAPFAKIVFTSNTFPKIADKSGAMERRMRIVSSDRVIKPEEIITNFVENFTEDDYAIIISDALHAINALLNSGVGKFPDPEESRDMKDKLRLLQDHAYSFARSLMEKTTDKTERTVLDGAGVMSKYGAFTEFCKQRNYQVASLDTFREQICNTLDYDIGEEMSIEVFKSKEAKR